MRVLTGCSGRPKRSTSFFVYGVDLLHGFADGEAFVEDEALVNVGAVVFGQ